MDNKMFISKSALLNVDDILLEDFEERSKSSLMRDIYYKIMHLAKLNSNVILVGELGSGKSKLAKIIHKKSNRSEGPFYTFYCVDITENDYQEAFWGQLKIGKENNIELRYEAIEKANNGTLFLEEFSELSDSFKKNILTSYIKGCNNLFRYNKSAIPRLILSLNQESYNNILATEIWQKILDQVNPIVIMLPPLRERREDIPMMVEEILKEIKAKSKEFKDLKISYEALYKCFNYHWPGNIRQLKNAILQGAILSCGKTIESEHLPFSMSWQLPYELNNKRL